MRKAILLLAALIAFALFTACSSTEFLVLNDHKKRTPLDTISQVRFIYAPATPVIPENVELVGVMMSNTGTDCSAEEAVGAIAKTAKDLGADLVFVKEFKDVLVDKGYYNGTTYMSNIVHCQVLTADLLATKKEDEK